MTAHGRVSAIFFHFRWGSGEAWLRSRYSLGQVCVGDAGRAHRTGVPRGPGITRQVSPCSRLVGRYDDALAGVAERPLGEEEDAGSETGAMNGMICTRTHSWLAI